MSWLKRLLQKFFTEKEEKEKTTPIRKATISSSQTIETRMIYQYPKRNFRFPISIDSTNDNLEPKKKKESPTTTFPYEQKHHKKMASSPNMKERKQKTTNETIRKRPFRPTEIPSPIYGFKRPEKNVVEYELKEFFIEKPNLVNENDQVDTQDTLIEERQVESSEFILDKEHDFLENDEFIQEAAVTVEERDFNPIIQKDEENHLSSIYEESQKTTDLNNNKTTQEDFETEQEPMEEVAIHSSIEEMDEEFNTIETEEEQPFTIIEEKFAATENETADEEKMDKIVPLNIGEAVTEMEEELEITEEVVKESQSTNTDMDKVTTQNSRKQEQRRNIRRSSIPFNVLMFKEDREKLRKKQKENELKRIPQIENKKEEVQRQIKNGTYQFPPYNLLHPPVKKVENQEWLESQKNILNETLANFNVNASVVHVSQGPAVTRFEVQPERGVKVSKITNLTDDIKLSMAAKDIRIEAPIPGKRTVGIEIPNLESRPVQISEIIHHPAFQNSSSELTIALGLDISGEPVVTDIKKMPHGLIAGATGSGKSVCINSILISLLYKARPDELKLLLIDPKMVELAPFNHIPHLVSPVITDTKAATVALQWAVEEMERRYELLSQVNARNIGRFNEMMQKEGRLKDKMPYIVVVIDELADLMMVAPQDVEDSIARIAQKARACGIHLILATQRPSVDVITGLIKANIPTRIAFAVSSQIDSRTIIDMSGAEKLLGRGDMLFLGSGSSKPVRLQGTFVSDEEIDRVIAHVRGQGEPEYLFEQEELLKKTQFHEEEDELFMDCCEFVVNQGTASTSLLQRQFRIGYNRAARLIDMMEEHGIISGSKGSKPRDVLITPHQLKEMQKEREF